jgi:hypothetical protein
MDDGKVPTNRARQTIKPEFLGSKQLDDGIGIPQQFRHSIAPVRNCTG